MTLRKKIVISGYLMLMPAFIYWSMFVIYPISRTLWLSFNSFDIFIRQASWVGVQNYVRMLKDPTVINSIKNTLSFASCVISGEVALSLLLALLINRIKMGSSGYRFIYFIPYLSPLLAVSLIWLWLYEPSIGLINYFLSLIGLPGQKWLTTPELALPSIMIMTIWRDVGFFMLIFYAGLKAIPRLHYEAAEVDGASEWQKTRFITLPLIKPIVFFVLIISCMQNFQVFSQMYVMTKGGPVESTITIVYCVYETAFRAGKMGYSSSIVVLLLAIILSLTILQMRVGRFR